MGFPIVMADNSPCTNFSIVSVLSLVKLRSVELIYSPTQQRAMLCDYKPSEIKIIDSDESVYPRADMKKHADRKKKRTFGCHVPITITSEPMVKSIRYRIVITSPLGSCSVIAAMPTKCMHQIAIPPSDDAIIIMSIVGVSIFGLFSFEQSRNCQCGYTQIAAC
jgi:hypothetical protein